MEKARNHKRNEMAASTTSKVFTRKSAVRGARPAVVAPGAAPQGSATCRTAPSRRPTPASTARRGHLSATRTSALAEDASGDGLFSDMGNSTPPEFKLKFVWGKDTLAFAVDQILGKGNSSPLTEYFFWPQDDAWENLKAVLEAKDWIPASEKISMLNRVTEVINFWTPQEGQEQNSTEQAKAKFQDCGFTGTFY